MSITKVLDIESIRFAAPDLAPMRTFLLDFGLVDLGPQDDGVLRMRAWGDAPCVHETELGEPGFRTITLRAASLADLEALAAHDGTVVEEARRPGGGKCVRLTDPDGFAVEVVAGGVRAEPLPMAALEQWNIGNTKGRQNLAKRIPTGPSTVLRLGHGVFIVSDLQATWAWWRERFGLLMSDDVHAPNGVSVAMFVRCDRGEHAVDHHTLNFATVPGKPAQFHHVAFEVNDFDDLMVGHDHLMAAGYNHAWGIGRHFLGSQVFDYWLDPFGNRIEHWTDGDLFGAEAPVNYTDVEEMLGRQWGPEAPAGFV